MYTYRSPKTQKRRKIYIDADTDDRAVCTMRDRVAKGCDRHSTSESEDEVVLGAAKENEDEEEVEDEGKVDGAIIDEDEEEVEDEDE